MRYQDLAVAVFTVVCCWTSGVAQLSDEGGPPKPPPPGEEGRLREKGPSKFLEGLPAETRERFEAAREKALQDPKLQELRRNAERANRDFFKAVRDKMLEIDPGLADIVRKRAVERRAWKVWRDEGPLGFGSLSDGEREKLMSVLEKVDNDPAVQAAKRKKREANTAEERNVASEDYRKAIHDAMVKADPTIAPILDKLAPKQPPPPNPAENAPIMKDPQ